LVFFGAEGIFRKDGGACEAEHLGIYEEFFDVSVGVSKLAAVAFIEDKYKFLVLEMFDLVKVMIFDNGVVQLWDGGDDQFGGIASLSCPISLLVLVVLSTLPLANSLNSPAV